MYIVVTQVQSIIQTSCTNEDWLGGVYCQLNPKVDRGQKYKLRKEQQHWYRRGRRAIGCIRLEFSPVLPPMRISSNGGHFAPKKWCPGGQSTAGDNLLHDISMR